MHWKGWFKMKNGTEILCEALISYFKDKANINRINLSQMEANRDFGLEDLHLWLKADLELNSKLYQTLISILPHLKTQNQEMENQNHRLKGPQDV
jgi:hypothetical protein